MPKRTDIKSILIIGSGPIVIGQACEFDYSGTQGAKALKEEGYRVILVNSNPATIMTDSSTADKIYIEPITEDILIQIIKKERPDAILPTLGGQTALNLALALGKHGVLKKYKVALIGVSVEAIERAEDRGKFKQAIEGIKIWNDITKKYDELKCPKSRIVESLDEAKKTLKNKDLELPLIIRPSLTLGGAGSGRALDYDSFLQLVEKGLDASPIHQVQIDQDLTGWKEFEMEAVRDKDDNGIIVCSIENIDPMGVHTGDSITIAPAMTLTDKEYQFMRDASLEILRKIGIETGGSNVQFAVNPKNGEMIVIEMNPRVSRSSALVSKATGFPIAKVATKLAVGYTLDEIRNDIACGIPKEFDYLTFKNVVGGNAKDKAIEAYIEEQRAAGVGDIQLMQKVLPASFEPSIDYVVIKMPKFNFEKLHIANPVLGTQMQSVGEVMAIGRSFNEAMEKAIKALEKIPRFYADLPAMERLKINSPSKVFDILDALREGHSVDKIAKVSMYDKWFVEQLANYPPAADNTRRVVFKKIDTCANEFNTSVNYFYSTKETGYKKLGSNEVIYNNEAKAIPDRKVIILGSGANRIGQGIEFDYACVQASQGLREIKIKSIMINSNPETVSTDYDMSDRLYFEPVVAEYVMDIILNEMDMEIPKTKIFGRYFTNLKAIYDAYLADPTEHGAWELKCVLQKYISVAISFGGQTSLNLRHTLQKNNIPIFGKSNVAIEICDNRAAFERFCKDAEIRRPRSFVCKDKKELEAAVKALDYNFIIRPTSVIGGRGMAIITGEKEYKNYLKIENEYLPCVVDEFLRNAPEFDVDLIKDRDGRVLICGILEQLEYAGVHSGDSSACLPVFSVSEKIEGEIKEICTKIVTKLNVLGAVNIQIAVCNDKVYVIEVNPRVSRTLPFISKAVGIPFVAISAKVMAGKPLRNFFRKYPIGYYKNAMAINKTDNYYLKEAVFSFEKFHSTDVVLNAEMKSTGEVMGIGRTFNEAFIKAQLGAKYDLTQRESLLLFTDILDERIVKVAKQAIKAGLKIISPATTFAFLKHKGVEVVEMTAKNKNAIKDGKVGVLIGIGTAKDCDVFALRRQAILKKIPYITNIETAGIFLKALGWYYTVGDVKIIE